METNNLSLIKREFVKGLLAEGKREDGRGFDEYRNLEIETGFVSKAQGSARVKLGNTQLVAGVKVQVESPYNDTPNRGNFMTSAELNPIASPNFEPGPPRIEAIELARVTDRSLRESGIIDMEALAIEPGEKVWAVFVDLHILDYDGNLFDACSIAALAAVMSAKLPAVCPKTKLQVYKEDKPMPLRLDNATFSTTFVKIGKHILADPGLYEELIADCRITIGVDPKGNLRACQKGGYGSFSVEEVKTLRQKSETLSKEIHKRIQESIKKSKPKAKAAS
jgi:exosome complex component RRP42